MAFGDPPAEEDKTLYYKILNFEFGENFPAEESDFFERNELRMTGLPGTIAEIDKIYFCWTASNAPATASAKIYSVFLLEILKLVIYSVLESLFSFFSKDMVSSNSSEALQLARTPASFSFSAS